MLCSVKIGSSLDDLQAEAETAMRELSDVTATIAVKLPEVRLCSAAKGEAEMAVSTCIKCNGHSFELALFTPLGDSRKLTIVQCSACGTPVCVLDPAMGPQIEALKSQIAAIDDRLNRIAKALQD